MKVLFILPCIYSTTPCKTPNSVYHPGVASLSAYLKKYGHWVNLIHYNCPPTKRQLVSQISKNSPHLVAFSVNSHIFHYIKKWSKWIKDDFDIPIICGGVHSTIDSEKVISQKEIDIICRGEGEEALLELCTKYEQGGDITNILNLWVKKNEKIYKNPLRPLIEDLDSLPFPDRGIFDDKRSRQIGIMTSRGCIFNCSYCCTPQLRDIYKGNFKEFIRYRSVKSLIQYIKKIIPDYSCAENIRFYDDVLNLDKTRFKEFAVLYKDMVNFPYECHSHVNLIDKETVELLKYSGCRKIFLGIESGNDYIRKKIYNRPIEKEQIVRAFKLCQNEGIKTRAFNMIGAPFEDMRAILDTVKLNAEVRVAHGIGLGELPTITYPYIGTKLYRICEDNKFMTGREFDSLLQGTVIRQPFIKSEQIIFVMYSFNWFVRMYKLIDRLPNRLRNFCGRLLDSVFLYNKLPYSYMIFILKTAHEVIYRLFKFEIWTRKKLPWSKSLFNILIKR